MRGVAIEQLANADEDWIVAQPPSISSPARTRALLDRAATVLDRLEPSLVHDAPRQVLADTRALIDRNRSRIAGRTPDGAVRGYSNHPDYAELGRVQASVGVLDSVAHAADGGTATAAAAKVVDDGALAW